MRAARLDDVIDVIARWDIIAQRLEPRGGCNELPVAIADVPNRDDVAGCILRPDSGSQHQRLLLPEL
ncbi:MAG: hypothetical protein JRG70_09060, partial [Deltaproteobacteria bacterium]|nr:hypothetical protein [Deltaproteobacteria bacterium]